MQLWRAFWQRSTIGTLCVLGAVGAAPAMAPQAAVPTAIGIKALLFNGETGGFSEDVIADQSGLGQVPIGDYRSTSMLVVVRISYGRSPTFPSASVRLLANVVGRRPRVFVDRTVPLRAMSEDNTGHVAFWLDGTGCEPLKLRVTLVGAGAVPAKYADLPFICYE